MVTQKKDSIWRKLHLLLVVDIIDFELQKEFLIQSKIAGLAGRNKNIVERHMWSLYGYQIIEKLDSKELVFPQKSLTMRRNGGRLRVYRGRSYLPEDNAKKVWSGV